MIHTFSKPCTEQVFTIKRKCKNNKKDEGIIGGVGEKVSTMPARV
jgi:hypothetical protein